MSRIAIALSLLPALLPLVSAGELRRSAAQSGVEHRVLVESAADAHLGAKTCKGWWYVWFPMLISLVFATEILHCAMTVC